MADKHCNMINLRLELNTEKQFVITKFSNQESKINQNNLQFVPIRAFWNSLNFQFDSVQSNLHYFLTKLVTMIFRENYQTVWIISATFYSTRLHETWHSM